MDANYDELVNSIKSTLSLASDQFEKELLEARQTYNEMLDKAKDDMQQLYQNLNIRPREEQPEDTKDGIFLSVEQYNALTQLLESVAKTLEAIKDGYK